MCQFFALLQGDRRTNVYGSNLYVIRTSPLFQKIHTCRLNFVVVVHRRLVESTQKFCCSPVQI